MSATNRGGTRNEEDFYATPAWCVHRLLEKVKLPAGRWLEPGAGDGAIIRAVTRSDVAWVAVEKRHDAPEDLFVDWLHDDFLGDRTVAWAAELADHGGIRVALGNPPYKLAQQFADRCFMLAETTALLLRLNFLGSEERAAWWEKHPADVYVLPNRPSFCVKVKCVVKACGRRETYATNEKLPKFCLACHGKLTVTRTDACEYAWFVWGQGGRSEIPTVHHLALTPEAERYQRAA